MKRLYYQEADPQDSIEVDPETGAERSNEAEFKRRIENRKEYTFGYFVYLYMKVSECCGCCLKRLRCV